MTQAATSGVKHPEVTVQLSGEDGNAMFIMARVRKAMQRAGVSAEDITAYVNDAKAGDYDHLLRVTMQTVNVE